MCGGDCLARGRLPQARLRIEAERVAVDVKRLHHPLALRAWAVELPQQAGERLRLLCMAVDVSRIAAQDEVLLVPAQHQHAGEHPGILDALQLLVDAADGRAHGAFQPQRRLQPQLLVDLHEAGKGGAVGLEAGADILQFRCQFGPGIRLQPVEPRDRSRGGLLEHGARRHVAAEQEVLLGQSGGEEIGR